MKPLVFRKFLFFRLPIAWLAGLRLGNLTEKEATILVKLSKLSQNPFKSIFWAVQGMAAELSTGVLLITEIMKYKEKISFLVIEQQGKFYKKAVGKIRFTCVQAAEVKALVKEVTLSNNPETITLLSKGYNQNNELVAEFTFLWSLKKKTV